MAIFLLVWLVGAVYVAVNIFPRDQYPEDRDFYCFLSLLWPFALNILIVVAIFWYLRRAALWAFGKNIDVR